MTTTTTSGAAASAPTSQSVIRTNSTKGLTPLATVPVGGASSSVSSPAAANAGTGTTSTATGSSNRMPVGGAFGVVGGLVDAIARDAGSAAASSASNVGKRPPTHRQSSTSTTGSSGNSNHQSIAESRVDFIAPSEAVKSLFALPLANDVGVNIALHNIGNGTLLMDAAHDTVASYEEVEDTANIGAGNVDGSAGNDDGTGNDDGAGNDEYELSCDFKSFISYLRRGNCCFFAILVYITIPFVKCSSQEKPISAAPS